MNKRIKTILFSSLGILLFVAYLLQPKIGFAAENLEQYEKYRSDGNLNLEKLTRHIYFNNAAETLIGISGEHDDSGNLTSAGAIQVANNLISSIYANPPASGIYYAFNILDSIGAAPAYAQQTTGIGFHALQPILPVWKAFRNATYAILTVLFVIMGLAIMFRVKISPQVVLTIENALPKLVGTLILVTFSYAIAGLMIDLMYVVIALGINILKSSGISSFPWLSDIASWLGIDVDYTKFVLQGGILALLPMIGKMAAVGTLGTVAGGILLGGVVGMILGGILTAASGPVIIAGLLGGGAAGAGIGAILIAIVWVIVVLFLILKLLFNLVKAYIKIIMSIIFAPLQIMVGAVPGVNAGGFGNWLKGIATELLIFPAVIIVAIIGSYLITPSGFNMWMPPLLSGPDIGGDASFLAAGLYQTIIGMGFLLTIANVPNMIRKAMGIDVGGFGSAVGQAIGAGVGVVSYLPKQVGSMVGAGVQKAGTDVVSDLAGRQFRSLRSRFSRSSSSSGSGSSSSSSGSGGPSGTPKGGSPKGGTGVPKP